MKYEETPAKHSKKLGKDVRVKAMDELSTMTILWHVTKRHKTGILLTWAIVATVLYLFPPAPDIILGLIAG